MSQSSKHYLLNAWYVACTAQEINDRPLGRKICDREIAFYRGVEGKVSAVEDFCPHRGAKLSLGQVCDGLLTCGYHGLQMGGDGHVVAMPGQRVRGFPTVASYPVEERYGFVWVWPGDPLLADPSKVHRLAWGDDPEWVYSGGLYHVECNYQLMIDNLMDLTHETYVHSTSIGQKEIDETPCHTRVDGDEVITSRTMDGIYPPPLWKEGLRIQGLPNEGPVDRWQICRFTPPSHVMIEVGVALEGKGGYEAAVDDKVESIVVDFITPETDTSHWYFWGSARRIKFNSPEQLEKRRLAQGGVFTEDKAVLEAQQRNLLANPERRLTSLNIDAGGMQARRVLDRLIAQERAAMEQRSVA